uniref:CfaE/CblD family pilus tip adhesin n=1 Tax=Scandinavium goeteborgense TaxID=1851514 RepID=UPI00135CF43E|nr:CfaE/CblD family pilus tip adhesin [Scandinavium goeteborgense]
MQNFVRTFLICLAMSLVLIFSCTQAKAESIAPAGRDTTITADFDKSALPAQVDIWINENGGYDTSNPGLWARNNWRCLSNSKPDTGQCKSGEAHNNEGDWDDYGITSIPLLFIEKRSGLHAVINVMGYHMQTSTKFEVTSAEAAGSGVAGSGTNLYMYITPDQLAALPVGGIWQANLTLELWQWSPGKKLANWNAHITLNVTDNNNQQIYLPEFGTAAPHVDLNLRPLPGTTGNQAMLSGTASLDMCLYDGYNANSSTFTLNAHDQTSFADGREASMFSVYNQGQGDEGHRIDYHLEILDPTTNAYSTMVNMQNYVIRDIQKVSLKSVYLPGIPQPVVCVPSRLRFTTPEFAIASKQAGQYTARLRLFLTTQM